MLTKFLVMYVFVFIFLLAGSGIGSVSSDMSIKATGLLMACLALVLTIFITIYLPLGH